MSRFLSSACSAAALSVIFVPLSASAAFSLFDNFDSYALGPLSGRGPAGNTWTAQASASVASTGGSDNVASFAAGTAGGANYRLLTPASLSITNATTAATVYFNFTLSSVGAVGPGGNTQNNWNFIVTDDSALPIRRVRVKFSSISTAPAPMGFSERAMARMASSASRPAARLPAISLRSRTFNTTPGW